MVRATKQAPNLMDLGKSLDQPFTSCAPWVESSSLHRKWGFHTAEATSGVGWCPGPCKIPGDQWHFHTWKSDLKMSKTCWKILPALNAVR